MPPQAARVCGSFWWRDVFQFDILFRGIAKSIVGDGKTVLFWDDLWEGSIRSRDYPRLYSFAKHKNDTIA